MKTQHKNLYPMVTICVGRSPSSFIFDSTRSLWLTPMYANVHEVHRTVDPLAGLSKLSHDRSFKRLNELGSNLGHGIVQFHSIRRDRRGIRFARHGIQLTLLV